MTKQKRPARKASRRRARNPQARKRRNVGGKAGGGGYSFQAQVAALVAAHIVAGRRLGWAGNSKNDFPIALLSETGSLGDDIGVELADPSFRLDAQVKKGLTAGAKLLEALEGFKALPKEGTREAILVVDPLASRPILSDLRDDLRRLRGGRTDELKQATKDVIAFFDKAGAPHVYLHLAVVPIQIEERSDAHRGLAIEYLANVFGDPIRAEVAFELLENYCLKQIKDRGRLAKGEINDYLLARGFASVQTTRLASDSSQRAAVALAGNGPAQAGIALEPPSPAGTPVDRLTSNIDSAKRLLEEHQPERAFRILVGLEKELSRRGAADEVSPRTRMRLEANLGAALFRLGRVAEARSRFERATALQPSDAPTRANLAHILLIEGQPEGAERQARIALSADPNNAHAWGVLAETGAEGGEPPIGVRESSEWLTGKAANRLAVGDYDAAIPLLRQAAKIEGTAERLFLLAHALFAARRSDDHGGMDSKAAQVHEAEDLVSRALEAVGTTEYSALLGQGLLLRASIRRQLGDLESAEEDAVLAWRLHPRNTPDLWRAAAILAGIRIENGRPRDALKVLDRLQRPEDRPPIIWTLIGRACAALGKTAAVQSSLSEALASLRLPMAEVLVPEIVATCVEIALDAGLADFAGEVLERTSDLALGWLGELSRGRVAIAHGDVERAVDHLARAADGAEVDATRLIRFELASALRQLGRFEEAVAAYDDGNAWATGEPFRAPFIYSLIESRDLVRAGALLTELESAGPLPEWALVPMAVLLDLQGDVERALPYLKRARDARPESISTALRLNALYLRLGAREAAAGVLEALLAIEGLSPRERLVFAGQLFELGDRETAVQEAYRSIREARGTAEFEELRAGFSQLFMFAEQHKAAPRPVAVGANVRVTLEPISATGKPVVISVVAKSAAPLGQDEFSIGDPLVSSLIGRRVGDTVRMGTRRIGRGSFKLTSIDSLPGLEYAATLAELAKQGPEVGGIDSVPLGEEGTVGHLMPILSRMFTMQGAEDEALEVYRKHGLPLGVLARLLGRPIHEAYWFAASRGRLWTEHGDSNSQARTLAAARTETPLVLTRSALATLSSLKAA